MTSFYIGPSPEPVVQLCPPELLAEDPSPCRLPKVCSTTWRWTHRKRFRIIKGRQTSKTRRRWKRPGEGRNTRNNGERKKENDIKKGKKNEGRQYLLVSLALTSFMYWIIQEDPLPGQAATCTLAMALASMAASLRVFGKDSFVIVLHSEIRMCWESGEDQ